MVKTFIFKNKFALVVALCAVLVFVWTLFWGGQLCNCTSVESSKTTGSRTSHGFYYHK